MLLIMILGYTRIRECHRGESFGAVNLYIPVYIFPIHLGPLALHLQNKYMSTYIHVYI